MPHVAGRRTTEIAKLQRLIERMQLPRLSMMLIVALTAAVGFLASFALLHVGVGALWLRYPIAIAVAYAAFLFFLWCWLRLRRNDVFDGFDILTPGPRSGASFEEAWEGGGGRFGGGGASGSFDDSPVGGVVAESGSSLSSAGSEGADAASAFDLEDLAFVLLAIAALIGGVWAAVWIVWAAPALLAELMLDAALATGLYRRLQGVERDHWLRTAVRRTAWPFAGVALLFSLVGGGLQIYAPHAKSIGQVIQHYKATR
jgi:uncharacterized membrane protein YgcG